MITLNVTALTRLTYAAAPAFVARGAGTIINIGSVVGIAPERLNGVYGAGKAYVLALTHSLQHELADKGVRVQAVLPAATATDIWEKSGFHHSKLAPGTVMSTENMVDAALVGLDQGEVVTIPPLQDGDEWARFEASRRALAKRLAIRRRRRDTGPSNPRGRSLNAANTTFEDRAMTSRSVVFAEPMRTAIGAFGGTLKDVPVPNSWRVAIRAAVERAGLKPEEIETAAMGNVIQAGTKDESRPSGGGPGRPAGDGPGHDCEPGLRFGGASDCVRSAGDPVRQRQRRGRRRHGKHRSGPLSRAARSLGLSPRRRAALRQRAPRRAQRCFLGRTLGWHTEDLVEKYQVTREAQDQWALRSQQRFARAQAAGHFKSQIAAVQVPGKKGPTPFEQDEANRPDTTIEALARLKPAFRPDGAITAGNAPGLDDTGAAMVLADEAWGQKRGLEPAARLVAYGVRRSSPACSVSGRCLLRQAGVAARRLGDRLNRAGGDQ